MSPTKTALEPKVNLLIADDNRDTLDLLLFKTATLGWSATSVSSASQIISAMNECANAGSCYDAIIADVNFYDSQSGPRMTGITAVREVRKVMPDIPVIFVTAYTNTLMREEIRRLNSELVPKPFDIDFLFNRVAELVKWHRTSLPARYDGVERRTTSFNLTGFTRRATDRPLQASPRISAVLAQLRDEAK